MKLLSIERNVEVFDNKTEKSVERIQLSITIDDIRECIATEDDDPLYYGAYILTEEQINFFNRFATAKKVVPDFSKYYYMLTCVGEYDWNG